MATKYDEAQDVIKQCGLDIDFEGGGDLAFVEGLEKRLGVHLPNSYKRFLIDYGVLEIAGQEFYGEWPRDRIGGGLPSFVFATENGRKIGEISANDIVIGRTGLGPDFVIDCTIQNEHGESPVFMQSASYDRSSGTVSYEREKIADSFGEFFLNEVRMIADSDQT